MPIRQTRYGYAPRAYPQQDSRVSIFEPTQGMDAGQAPQELGPGFTPVSQNWIHSGGYLQPRSGMSRYDSSYQLGDAAMFGAEMFDVNGRRHGLASSSQTIAMLKSGNVQFSNLSWVAATGASDQTMQSDIGDGIDGASVYEPVRDKNIAVLTNNRQTPKFLDIADSTTTFSDFTWVNSQFSKARAVCANDYRLVWFNVQSTQSSFPTRVVWSVRGQPLDYALANGASFEDLLDMRGVGVKVVSDKDSIVLFSDEQIWRGRKRGDIYAYDFYCVNRTLGCPYPRTIHTTPYGIVFLGRDQEMYLLQGDQTVPLGPTGRKGVEQGDHSRVQLHLQRTMQNGDLAFGLYNSEQNRSEVYFTSNETNTNLYPQKRLDYNFDNQSFFLSATSLDWSAGFEMQDIDEAVTWDQVPQTFDQYNTQWDSGDLGVPARRIVTFSSAGTPYRFRSTQTSDDGNAIDARWRSHGLGGADAFRFESMYEVWVDYSSDSSSTMGVHTSNDLGNTWNSQFTRGLSASSHNHSLFPVFETGQSPVFEIRVNDGSVPKISRIQVNLRDAGRMGGAL